MNNNKKIFLIFIFASIIALLTVFLVAKYNVINKTIKPEQVFEENFIEEIKEEISEEADKNNAVLEEAKPEINYSKKIENQPNVKVEIPEIKKIIVEEVKEDIKEDTIMDNGIQKIEGSNVIEITREFKIETPSKYSFK